MSQIKGSSSQQVFQIKAWSGLNENPDGDTKLKMGEAARLCNFKITRDGNLQRRPGTKTLLSLNVGEIKGLWTGFVMGTEYVLCAAGGKLWQLWSSGDTGFEAQQLGALDTTNSVQFFGFSNLVYMLNGLQYKQWDGSSLTDVEGYRPLVCIALPPTGGGETLEQVNKLNGKRRCWISPDGSSSSFSLPESGLESLDYVKDLKSGQNLDSSAYSCDLEAGIVSFAQSPAPGVNSYELGWTMAESFRSQVCAMRYMELYSGSQDTRVFLYGDGGHKAFYSDLDYEGKPRADYFPDLNEVAVGDENTPITGLIRHYSSLACFKTNSAWTISSGLISLADGSTTASFYVKPTNRSIGNAAPGQVRLVDNSPRTLHGNDLFQWKNYSAYSANLSLDERQAERISDRIYSSLAGFDLAQCRCFDDNDSQEYYICLGDKALVHNYAADAWYYYEGFEAACMLSFHGGLYLGSFDGKLKQVSADYLSDDGRAINAYWESGSMSFGQDYVRKHSAQLWLGIKPQSCAQVTVTVQTDKKSAHSQRVLSSTMATFKKTNFSRFSFNTNRKPQMTRLKIKAKKFVFYKLVFMASEPDTTVTILAADMQVRFTGHAK